MRSQQQRITLPKLRSQFKQLPNKGPREITFRSPQRYHRYNTESLLQEDFGSFGPKISQKKSKRMKFSLNKDSKQKKIELHDLLQSNRESSLKRKEALSKIIDTRKSIRILVDYFQSQSQEMKTINNSNYYHSPKKLPINMVELRQSIEEYQASKKSLIGGKKKLKTELNRTNNETQMQKKKRINNYSPSFKIQNVILNHPSHPRIEEGHQHKTNHQIHIRPSDSPTVIQIGKIRQKKLNKKLGSEKITHFGAWNVNLQETEYMIL